MKTNSPNDPNTRTKASHPIPSNLISFFAHLSMQLQHNHYTPPLSYIEREREGRMLSTIFYYYYFYLLVLAFLTINLQVEIIAFPNRVFTSSSFSFFSSYSIYSLKRKCQQAYHFRRNLKMSTFASHNPHHFSWQQTMLRIKDPKVSVPFYENHFGFKLIHR